MQRHTHLHKLFAYQYISLSSFMPFAVTMRTHTKTVCLPDRRHMPAHRCRTSSIYRTFANGTKLQAITPSMVQRRAREPWSLRCIILCLQRHSPAAASVLSRIPNLSSSHCVFFVVEFKKMYLNSTVEKALQSEKAGDKDDLRESMLSAFITWTELHPSI